MRIFKWRIIFFLVLSYLTGQGWAPALAVEEQKKDIPAAKPPLASGVPTVPATPPTVAQIHRDLQEIIRIHQMLQAQHHAQIREIHRITEQARLHQKLLRDLTPAQALRTGTAPVKGPNIDEMIRLQKIQLLQQEAVKSRSELEALKKGQAQKAALATASGEEEAEKPEEVKPKRPIPPPPIGPVAKTDEESKQIS
jgi:hypothetical protein